MKPIFHARLVNGVWGDPGLCIDLKFQRRAILFDIGDVSSLSTRVLLRVSDVFVSHTHMDHFAGFDHLLRVCLGRDTGVRLFGPQDFISQVGHKLAAYTWDLVQNYTTDFCIDVHELGGDSVLQHARFRSRARFTREDLPARHVEGGVLLADEQFRVRAMPFAHHDIVSLGFSFEESTHINVWKNRLEEKRLPSGPWLTELKRLARSGAPDETPVNVRWRTREGHREETWRLGELKRDVLEFVPGQRLCYITDVSGDEANRARIREFVREADILFIEAVFREADRELAERKSHLTTVAAARIAREAGVSHAEPFHFSARYRGREAAHRAEFESGMRVAAPTGSVQTGARP
jgi:ribonuclease Z